MISCDTNATYPLIPAALLTAAISGLLVEQVKTLAADLFNQCFPLQSLEKNLAQLMKGARNSLLYNEEDAGNKHNNLVLMRRADEVFDLPDLEIPEPKGIKSDDVSTFLRKETPEIFVHRDALNQLYTVHEEPSPFLEQPAAISLLSAIEQAIDRAFNQSEDLNGLNAPTKWLLEREKAGDFLMVRSSGAEDSELIANAGGNLSRRYVKASPKEFMEAVGSVIKSYFSKASLQNLLNGGMNPFQGALKLDVIVQLLIGEPVGGAIDPNQIPVSFVLFTNEPLYTGKENFRVMRLSASYGHGEGLVNSEGIATDTALILHSEAHPSRLYTIYDNQKKPTRLAPIQQESTVILKRVPNPKYLANRPAINQEMLNIIYRSSIVMESLFNAHPIDIEGVAKNGTIYFVQARPIKRKPLLPTFLNDKRYVIAKVEGEVLVAGKASVITTLKREQILIATTLKEAEAKFHSAHQLIIVSTEEPQNSHPVVNFSFLRIPCLYISDQKELQELLKKMDEDHPIAACMQTGTLHLWDETQGSLKEAIQEGFAVHPAKIASSLPSKNPPKITSLLNQLKEATFLEDELRAIDQITEEVKWLPKEIAQIEASIQKPNKRLNILKELHQKIESTLEETRAIFKAPKERLQKLLHLKILGTLLAHDPKPLLSALSTLIDYQSTLSHPSHAGEILLSAESVASPEAFAYFRQFLTNLEPLVENKTISPSEWQEFTQEILILEKTGGLSRWLTFLPQEPEALNVFRQMREEPSDQILMQEMVDLQQEQLKTLIERLSSQDLLERIQASSKTTRAVAYKVMNQAVDLLDSSLKKAKMSDAFDSTEFKALLKLHFRMMKSWSAIVPSQLITNHPLWPLERYLNKVEEILDSLNIENLTPSRGFSVSAAILSAGTVFDRHLPKSAEDMLTLLHQNSLSWISALNDSLLTSEKIEKSLLPDALKQAIREMKEQTFPRRRGIEFKDKKIILHYNVPLNSHSGRIDLIYDSNTSKMVMQGYLLGEGRGRRWSDIARWAEMLQNSHIFPAFQAQTLGSQETTFSWSLSSEMLPLALNEYSAMTRYSLETQSYKEAMEELFDRWQNRRELDLLTRECLRNPDPAFHRFYKNLAHTPESSLSMLISARNAFKSTHTDVRRGALELYGQLVDREEGHEEAQLAAKDAFKSRNVPLMHSALQLLERFEPFSAAIKDTRSTDESVMLSAFETIQRTLYEKYI